EGSDGAARRDVQRRAFCRHLRGAAIDQGDARLELRTPECTGRQAHRLARRTLRSRQPGQGSSGPSDTVRQPRTWAARGDRAPNGRHLSLTKKEEGRNALVLEPDLVCGIWGGRTVHPADSLEAPLRIASEHHDPRLRAERGGASAVARARYDV